MFVPFGEYAPDQPDYNNPGSAVAYNVVPRTSQSYGPMASLVPFATNTLASRCQGAFATSDNTGNTYVFAGDASSLYQLSYGSLSFANVTQLNGVYATEPAARWRFAQYGQQIIATNFHDPIQVITLAGTHFAPLSPTAPIARYIAVVKDFVVVGFTSDSNGVDPQQVHWSAINNPASWPAPGTSAALSVQSDYQTIAGDQGWLQGIVANLNYADAGLWFERGIWRMQYVGAPAIFQFTAVEGARGTLAPGSIAQLGSVVYYLGPDGFYAFDGSASQPIGVNRVDKAFYADLNPSQLGRIESAVDPINQLVYWAYPGIGSAGGLANRLIVYNVALNRWSMIHDVSCELLCRSLSMAYSIDQLNILGIGLDQLPVSLDSRAWTAKQPLLAAFDGNHRLSYFTGVNLAPTIDTPEIATPDNQRVIVRAARPYIDGGTASVAIAARQSLTDPVSYGSAVSVNNIGTTPQHVSGRYVRARLTLAAGSVFNHAQGIDLDVVEEGAR